MDPITHTFLGAAAAHAIVGHRLGRPALLFGAAGGAMPDIDVAWGFLADPAVPWEHHRHFTHALAFVPIGGLIVAGALLLVFKRWRSQAGLAYAAATIGVATHGINDALTSFGTFLYWPFSHDRVSWDVISIIDPLFTVPLLLGVIFALFLRSGDVGAAGRDSDVPSQRHALWPTRVALALAVLYLIVGLAQNQRVLAIQQQLADSRGHDIVRGRAMPTFGNIIVWRSLYEDADGRLHADAVRAGILTRVLVQPGESAQRLTSDDLPEDPITGERIAEVFEEFSAFADGYTARLDGASTLLGPGDSVAIGDMRYSMETTGFTPMWGIVITPLDTATPVYWASFARLDRTDGRRDAIRRTWNDIWRPGEQWVELPAK